MTHTKKNGATTNEATAAIISKFKELKVVHGESSSSSSVIDNSACYGVPLGDSSLLVGSSCAHHQSDIYVSRFNRRYVRVRRPRSLRRRALIQDSRRLEVSANWLICSEFFISKFRSSCKRSDTILCMRFEFREYSDIVLCKIIGDEGNLLNE